MSNLDIIRAWKDAEYREGLEAPARAGLPAHPAGLIELTDEEMLAATGRHDLNPVIKTLFISCDRHDICVTAKPPLPPPSPTIVGRSG